MSDPLIGQLTMFAGNFSPKGWAFCDGQLLEISEHQALFSLIGAIYGGDGRTTFALPDLRGRIPIHQGKGAGLSYRPIGVRGGAEKVAVSELELPSHQHKLMGSTEPASSNNPAGNVIAQSDIRYLKERSTAQTVTLSDAAMDKAIFTPSNPAPASQSVAHKHNNLQPSLCLNYIIALTGIYPSRQ